MGTRSFQKSLRASLAIKIFHVIRDVIYPYVSLILSETLGTRQRSVVEYASVLLANLPQTLRNDPEKVQKVLCQSVLRTTTTTHALSLADIQTLSVRRQKGCKLFCF